jgi:hypothetical protein
VTGLTAFQTTIFGLGGDQTTNLVQIDTATGLAILIGPLARRPA